MAELDTSQGGKHKKGGKRSKKMSTRVDLTPMVDLGFLLVTFFMLTTTFSKPSTLEVKWPPREDKKTDTSTPHKAVKESSSLTVILDSNTVYYYYKKFNKDSTVIKKVEYGMGLRYLLIGEKYKIQMKSSFDKTNSDTSLYVFVKTLESATYGRLVDLLDEIAVAQVKDFFLIDITNPEKERLLQLKGEK